MKSPFGKIGRKLSMQKSDVKKVRDHQMSAHLDELAQASKDVQDMRNCYDGLLSAAAATANSIYEFSESLNEMGNCLISKICAAADAESGNVLSTLGNLQLELQRIADVYRSYVTTTITNPTGSLLSELQKVEEMKLQCDEKREVYDHMLAQHREKGKLKKGKVDSSTAQKLQNAHDEYDEVARLCVFRVKSFKDGQWRSLLTQAARHHASQLNFFRKGLKAVEAVEPLIRNVTEKHCIDCQLNGLDDRGSQEDEPSGYDHVNDIVLSFDHRQKKQELDDDDDDGNSPNPMENKYNGELFGRQTSISSYSAPVYPNKSKTTGKLKDTQTKPDRKLYSHVLPPPVVVTRNPTSKPTTSVVSLTPKAQLRIRFPNPSTGSFSSDGSKVAQQQYYSGPLAPSKQLSFKSASDTTGPIPVTSTELPHPPSQAPVSQSNLPSTIGELRDLHELPRPPSRNPAFSKPITVSVGSSGHSASLFCKNLKISPRGIRAMLPSPCASPLPLPPSAVKIYPSNI